MLDHYKACFDTVNHSKLIEVLSRTIKDGRVISLIHKYLNSGGMKDGGFRPTEESVPRGGPLSPLCGNVMLIKDKLRKLTARGNKWSNPKREKKLNDAVRGWINHFRYADMKGLMEEMNKWLRHRIRAVYWKTWKRVRTRYKMLRALHLPEWKAHEMSNCRKGTWRAAKMLNSALTKTVIVDRPGYPSLSAHYLKVRINY